MREEVRGRLRLEFLEDRTLPAGAFPTIGASDGPPRPTAPADADNGAADEGSDPDAAEYQQSGSDAKNGADSHGTWYSDERNSSGTGYRSASEYADANEYKSAPRVDVAAFAPAPPAAVPPAASATPAAVHSGPKPEEQSPQVPNPQPAASPAPIAVARPADEAVEIADRPESDPAPGSKTPDGPTAIPVPVGAEVEVTSSAASPLTRLVDELAVRVDLPAEWDRAAARLLDGLGAAAETADPGPDWARLGYWAVSVAAVGVAVEFARHAAQARRPDSAAVDPRPLVVKR